MTSKKITVATERLTDLMSAAQAHFGPDTDMIFTSRELLDIRASANDLPIPGIVWKALSGSAEFRKLGAPRKGNKAFDLNNAFAMITGSAALPVLAPVNTPTPPVMTTIASAVAPILSVVPAVIQNLIPMVNREYVPFGNFHIVVKLIQSKKFFPTLITGLSGNGKTLMVEQAAAKLKREYIRTNITIESDEDSLIGGFRLLNGETVWHDGPVIEAMTRGAVLLLDEVDLGGDKVMCLQSILEGKGYFIKKTGRMVLPKAGFTIFLTANTKGKGNETGKFVGTRVLNEAMLDRINVCLEQPYPNKAQETKILMKGLERDCRDQNELPSSDDVEFVERIVDWAQAVREAYFNESINDVISTRRAGNIVSSYLIFGRDRTMAVETGVSRFDAEEIEAFTTFYKAIDANASKVTQEMADQAELDRLRELSENEQSDPADSSAILTPQATPPAPTPAPTPLSNAVPF